MTFGGSQCQRLRVATLPQRPCSVCGCLSAGAEQWSSKWAGTRQGGIFWRLPARQTAPRLRPGSGRSLRSSCCRIQTAQAPVGVQIVAASFSAFLHMLLQMHAATHACTMSKQLSMVAAPLCFWPDCSHFFASGHWDESPTRSCRRCRRSPAAHPQQAAPADAGNTRHGGRGARLTGSAGLHADGAGRRAATERTPSAGVSMLILHTHGTLLAAASRQLVWDEPCRDH